jgi:hypothetical protein
MKWDAVTTCILKSGCTRRLRRSQRKDSAKQARLSHDRNLHDIIDSFLE